MTLQHIETTYEIIGIGPITIEADVEIDVYRYRGDPSTGEGHGWAVDVAGAKLISATLGPLQYDRYGLLDFGGIAMVDDLERRAIEAWRDAAPKWKDA